jgi:hypothetical protein
VALLVLTGVVLLLFEATVVPVAGVEVVGELVLGAVVATTLLLVLEGTAVFEAPAVLEAGVVDWVVSAAERSM